MAIIANSACSCKTLMAGDQLPAGRIGHWSRSGGFETQTEGNLSSFSFLPHRNENLMGNGGGKKMYSLQVQMGPSHEKSCDAPIFALHHPEVHQDSYILGAAHISTHVCCNLSTRNY